MNASKPSAIVTQTLPTPAKNKNKKKQKTYKFVSNTL